MVLDEAYIDPFFNKEGLPPAYGARAILGELTPSYGLPYLGDDVVLQAPTPIALFYDTGDPENILSPDSPAWLFANGEDGFANTLGLDALFTNTSGTTPVTAIGDTIALGLDQSGNSNDMVQAGSSSARPVYGQAPVVGIKNRLRYTENLSNTFWIKSGITASLSTDGWWSLKETSVTNTHTLRPVSTTGTNVYRYEVDVMADGRDYAILSSSTAASIGVNLQAGWVVETTGSPSKVTVTPLDGGGYRIGFTHTTTSSGGEIFRVYCSQDGKLANRSYAGDPELGIKVRFPSLSLGADPAPYQKVTDVYSVTQAGIPSVPIAYSDNTLRFFSWTLPPGTYSLFIAGDLGCYFDTVVHAGGEFTVGPTVWTGTTFTGTSITDYQTLRQLIGPRHIIMPVILGRAFTGYEKSQLVAYAMARGCPGVWNESPELFVPPFTVSGSARLIDHGDGSYTHTSGGVSTLETQAEAAVGERYIVQFTVTNRTSGSVRFFAGSSASGGIGGDISSNTSIRRLTTSRSEGQLSLYFGSIFNGTVSNISLKRLTRGSVPV